MKKRLLKLTSLTIALLCIALLLASCADCALSVAVTDTGGALYYEYYADKELTDEYFGANLPDGLKKCEIGEKEGRPCYVYSKSYSSLSFSQLEKRICEITLFGEPGMNAFRLASISKRSLLLIVNPCVNENMKDIPMIGYGDAKEIACLSLTITMPYEIAQYSAGTLSPDGRTLAISLVGFTEEKSIEVYCVPEATSETSNELSGSSSITRLLGLGLITLAAIGTIVALSVFFIIRKKRKRAEAMPDTPIDKF